MNKKILITGNPTKEITAAILTLSPTAHTVSRSSCSTYSLDLANDNDIKELAEISTNYDIFINCSLIPNFGQTRILQHVWTTWKIAKKAGHIINLGSSVDYFFRPDNRLYPIEKRSLRDLNRSLSKHVTWHDSKIKCTYFSFGGVNTEKTELQWGHYSHFSTIDIAEYIMWIINSPECTNIDELHITPIQPMTKDEMNKMSKNVPVTWTSGDTRSFLITKE